MAQKLTQAQAEVIDDLVRDGWRDGFCQHDVFQRRDNADNAKRRTLRRLIDRGIIAQTGTTDIEGNPFYVIPSGIISEAILKLDTCRNMDEW